MKIRPVGAELCHENRQSEGRIDMTKLKLIERTNKMQPC